MTGRPFKVLVVDDELWLLELTQKILRFKFGYETIGAAQGREAIQIFKEHKPDLCILDVYLDHSDLNGIDVLREIRNIDKKIPCIMMTRITEKQTIDQARALGAAAYLLKPMDTQEWLAVVKEIADGTISARGGTNGQPAAQ